MIWATLHNNHNATIIGFMKPVKSALKTSGSLCLCEVDRSDPTPLHDQVASAIRRALAEGEARPNDRVPQAKDLATVLGVNTNTVLRALRVLRDEGLLELGRGRAIVVAGTPEKSAVIVRLRDFLEFARSQGYRPDDILGMIKSFQ